MQQPEQVAAIFADAWGLYADAIEILELGKPRVASEVAWGATKRATDALVLARTGRLPSGTGRTSGELRALAHEDSAVADLRDRFMEAVRELHAKCFYLRDCGPEIATINLVRQTADYIRDSTLLAQS